MVKEIDQDFVVDDYVGKVTKDSIEAPAVDANAESDPQDNEEIDEEVDDEFLVDNQVNKDSIEAPAKITGFPSTDSLHEAIMTGLCKPTKSSGNEPRFNRWLELIDDHKANNKGHVQLSEISQARVDTSFPIVYCTDPDKKFNNDKEWEPCVLKKTG